MADGIAVVQAAPYVLDQRLSLAESTCRFSPNGHGRETLQEGYYVLAIRKRGYRECLFRFSEREQKSAHSTLQKLNRAAEAET
jgi:hypothetical protein